MANPGRWPRRPWAVATGGAPLRLCVATPPKPASLSAREAAGPGGPRLELAVRVGELRAPELLAPPPPPGGSPGSPQEPRPKVISANNQRHRDNLPRSGLQSWGKSRPDFQPVKRGHLAHSVGTDQGVLISISVNSHSEHQNPGVIKTTHSDLLARLLPCVDSVAPARGWGLQAPS